MRHLWSGSGSERNPNIWTDGEVAAIREAVHDHTNPLHGVLLDVLLATGLRIGEAITLQAADVHEDGWIDVWGGKGGRDRRAWVLGGEQSRTLDTLLEVVDGKDPSEEVYPHTRFAFWYALNDAAEEEGVQRQVHDQSTWKNRVHPHATRSTWVRLAREHGLPWEAIAVLGWGSVESFKMMFDSYFHLDVEEAVDRLEARLEDGEILS